jgi:hypothetical protein
MKSTRRRKYWDRTAITALWSVLLTIASISHASAELNPGDTLNQLTWQQAQGMMPDVILHRFQTGQHISPIIALPPEALRWSSEFTQATETNKGKYSVNTRGVLLENDTGTYPRFMYGMPFIHIDPNDPLAPYQIMHNFLAVQRQIDDGDVLVNFFWVTPDRLERYVDLRGQGLIYLARWSGPIPNPDEVRSKILISGVAPYDVVGVATLDWNYLDQERWRSIWSYIPLIRRVRRLSSSNSSDAIFGSNFSRDDGGTFAGEILYFTWKLVGEKEALVPYTLPTPKTWEPLPTQGFVLHANENAAIMPWPGKSKLYEQSGQHWTGAAWWPTNLYLAKRPVWVLEFTPKDPYYGYGRQFLWIDKELFAGYYKEIYDRAGEYWKTIIRSGGIALNAEKTFSTLQTDFVLALNERTNAATVVLPLREGNDIHVNVGLDPQLFSSQGLNRFGK